MIEKERTFGAPWSASVWAITALFCIVVLPAVVVAVVMICNRAGTDGAPEGLLFLVAGIPTAIVVLCILCAPREYRITEDSVLVKRFGPDISIPLDAIASVAEIPKKEFGLTIRLFGSGGFLGSFGVFFGSRVGLAYAYVTDAARLVFLECCDGRRYLLSPDTPSVFVREVQTALEVRCEDDERSAACE